VIIAIAGLIRGQCPSDRIPLPGAGGIKGRGGGIDAFLNLMYT